MSRATSSRSTTSTPAQLDGAARPRARVEARPGVGPAARSPAGASRCCSRSRRRAPASSTEMAVVDPRRPPDLRPRRGGRASAPASRSRTSPARSPAYCAVDRGARVRPRARSSAMAARGRRAGRQPAVRPRAPVPGARRPPHAARALRRRSRAAGSRTSATATTSPRRSRSAPRCPGVELVGRVARRATSSTTTSSTGPATSAARSSSSPTRTRRCAAPTPSTPTCGRRWARRRRRDVRRARVRGLPGRRRADGRGRARARVFLHCLPAHRGEEVAAEVHRRPAVGRVAAGREPHARGARAARRRSLRGGRLMATLGKPQRQHRIAAAARGAGDLEPGAARGAARGRRRRRHAGDGQPRPRGARRGEGADPRRHDGVRDPRARQGAQRRPTTTCAG